MRRMKGSGHNSKANGVERGGTRTCDPGPQGAIHCPERGNTGSGEEVERGEAFVAEHRGEVEGISGADDGADAVLTQKTLEP